jgi:hypothetical protein
LTGLLIKHSLILLMIFKAVFSGNRKHLLINIRIIFLISNLFVIDCSAFGFCKSPFFEIFSNNLLFSFSNLCIVSS